MKIFTNALQELQLLLEKNLPNDQYQWLSEALSDTQKAGTARKLYLNYSLCGSRLDTITLKDFSGVSSQLADYLVGKEADTVEMGRIFFLLTLLSTTETFIPAVKNLIQIADKSELETFLKYLVLLPKPENYRFAAVEALRTNISTVFEAIAMDNPYPKAYFNDQQWNQMYLKAAFMQLDLSRIIGVDERANADLAKIISDYAHERWAAGRTIDPYFWRPVSNFVQNGLENDIKRLLASENPLERHAGALVCFHAHQQAIKAMLEEYEEIKSALESGQITWDNLK